MKNRIIGLFCFMAVHLAASAQTHVQLNLNVKHKLGDVTEFNRPKFINFHATINENIGIVQIRLLIYVMTL